MTCHTTYHTLWHSMSSCRFDALQYDMLWYGTVCYGELLPATICCEVSCHIMSCHGIPCHDMLCHVMSCHAMPCHVMSCCNILWATSLRYAMLCSVRLGYGMFWYLTHAMLYHIVPPNGHTHSPWHAAGQHGVHQCSLLCFPHLPCTQGWEQGGGFDCI